MCVLVLAFLDQCLRSSWATVLVCSKVGLTSARGWVDLLVSMVLVGLYFCCWMAVGGFQSLVTLNSVPHVLILTAF